MSEQPKDSSLVDFLLARIAEDEAGARLAEGDGYGRWEYVSDNSGPHIARHNPNRVLAECDAKRRIVGMYVGPTEDYEGNLFAIGGYGEAWVDAIKSLALPYADHPDYREEWKP